MIEIKNIQVAVDTETGRIFVRDMFGDIEKSSVHIGSVASDVTPEEIDAAAKTTIPQDDFIQLCKEVAAHCT